ncbi:MAG TPA: [FeFe] hydrogenase H-cluster maturation GTPase HydF [Firmicutes bacterium]|nr:[FeFe] hydrogenase H-cluster maturation GTPase HydF [Bacillota bacterium]
MAAGLGRTVEATPGHSPKPGPWAPGVASLSSTPRGERLHIAVFGRRNAGKSSLINALAGQGVAIVSDVPGTTTDPVFKTMEILPIGPVVLVDTAGIDDVGALGEMRVKRTFDILDATDLPILVVDPVRGVGEYELKLAELAREKKLPLLAVVTKSDLVRLSPAELKGIESKLGVPVIEVSNRDRSGIDELKRRLIELCPPDYEGPPLLRDMLQPGDLVVMVVPIDLEAPKGRLILPQVQALRDILDAGAVATVTKEDGLERVLSTLEAAAQKPRLVVTDSQAFGKVSRIVPEEVPLTSFSILFARHKGDLATLVKGAQAVAGLKAGDRVLIAEACTHHPIGDDIGRKKIPTWLNRKVGGALSFSWCSGRDFPQDLQQYKLVVHCGACMLNRKAMLSRLNAVTRAGVPIVNYGVLIAYLHGIFDRALRPFNAELNNQ